LKRLNVEEEAGLCEITLRKSFLKTWEANPAFIWSRPSDVVIAITKIVCKGRWQITPPPKGLHY